MISADFPLEAQQMACSGLAALGLLFLFIAFRLKEDKAFALLGVGILLLCLFVGMDVWFLFPGSRGGRFPASFLEWCQELSQVFASAYVFTALRFTRVLTGRPGTGALAVHGTVLGLFSAGFLLDALHPAVLFLGPREGEWETTPAYDGFFAPYLIGSFAYAIFLTARGLGEARGEERRTLRLILIAYGILFLGGSGDLAAMWLPGLLTSISGTSIGMLAMGVMGTFIFTDKLVLLYESRRRSLLKIAEIHGALHAHKPLGELGKSAALISEEIRGYVAGLKSDALSLREDPYSGYRAEAARIESARGKLEAYTNGILDFSRSGSLGEVSDLDAAALVEECLAAHFPDCGHRIRFSDPRIADPRPAGAGGGNGRIRGDKAKLIRALAELLRNAIQAEATTIAIRVRAWSGAVSLAIDDDGEGLGDSGTRESAEKIPRPFFTTRKSSGAFGLGASIAEGILKAHGGALRFYPKSGAGARGMLVNVILPRADAHQGRDAAVPDSRGNACLLVSDSGARIGEFLALCGNVGLRPLVLGSGDFSKARKPFGDIKSVIVDAEPSSVVAGGIGDKESAGYFRWTGDRLFPWDGGGNGRIFCEETLMALLSE
ncbi:MAG TPA: HAMP domain-containing sensor histidine kinase [Fibrobacteria bacterium]|nr:HAMP domain-containing sensor histidine kinase [Fibrobacteria bacterium]